MRQTQAIAFLSWICLSFRGFDSVRGAPSGTPTSKGPESGRRHFRIPDRVHDRGVAEIGLKASDRSLCSGFPNLRVRRSHITTGSGLCTLPQTNVTVTRIDGTTWDVQANAGNACVVILKLSTGEAGEQQSFPMDDFVITIREL